MKPIKLEIEGLYSYRDKQILDFRLFYPWKLFGIFGRTGDGKSSILDAIIFALYGKLDRLGRNLREAINPSKNAFFVNFIFEIDNQVYQIKRSFRRSGQSNVILYEKRANNWYPLQDKAREVEKQLTEILGLSFEEFTKVVILPQGKFAEFLRLTPSKRAQMLESLFNLEIFGEALFQRVSEYARTQSAILEEKKKDLRKLEDTSDKIIFVFEEELRKIQSEIRKKELEKVKLENKKQKLELLAKLLEQKESLEKEKREIEKKENEIKKEEEIIKRAEKLTPAKILYEELLKIQIECEEQEKKIEKIRQKILNENFKIKKEEKKTQHLIEKIEKKEIELAQKEILLKELLEDIEEINEKKIEIENITKKIEIESKNLKIIENETEDTKTKKNKIEREFQELSKEIKGLILKPEEKQIEDNIEDIQKNLTILEEKEKNIQELLSEKKKIEKEIVQLKRKIKKEWTKIFKEDFPSYKELISELKNKEEYLINKKNKISNELENLKRKKAAWMLAKKLEEGKPCPVCGSLVHPFPANKVEERKIKELEEGYKKTEEQILEIKNKIYNIIPITEKIKEKEIQIQNNKEKIRNFKEEKESIKRKIRQHTHFTESEIKIFIGKIKIKRKKREEIQEKIQVLVHEKERLTQKLHELEKRKIKAKNIIEQLKREKEKITEEIKEKEEKIIKEIGTSKKEIMSEIKKEKEFLKRKKIELQQKLEEQKEKLKNLEIRLEGEIRLYQKNKLKIKETREKLEILIKKEGFKNISEITNFLLSEEEIKKKQDRIKIWRKSRDEIYGRLKQIENQIKELPYQELPAQEPQKTDKILQELTKKIEKLREQESNLKIEITQKKKALKEKIELEKKVNQLEKEVILAEKLYQCLRGRNLVTFAARYLFHDILYEANHFLKVLLGERFLLKLHRENFSFSVYDLRFGHERPIETLSGGETFIVSFALALALSSYIQKTRVRPIHFFFIDEGFGSLDQDLLRAITEILYRLREQNRLVGIITHLEKFKEIFPTYILVEKDETGASRIRIRKA